jgi:hypothetical protein
VFEAVFKQFGVPKAIRTDNGVPFASDRRVTIYMEHVFLPKRSLHAGAWHRAI